MARNIVFAHGTYLYRFTDEERQAASLAVYCSVLTVGGSPYVDYKRYDPKTLYGYCQTVTDDYVIDEIPITQDNQRLLSIINPEWNLTKQITCARKEIRQLNVLLNNGQPVPPGDWPDPLVIPLLDITGLALKLTSGTSVRLQITHEPFFRDCGNPPQRKDPKDDRKKGTKPPDRNSGNPNGWNGTPPYGYSDDGGGLSDSEADVSDAAKPDTSTKVRIYVDVASANTGKPCGQEETSYKYSFDVEGPYSTEDWTIGPGGNFRQYCGKDLQDGFTLFWKGQRVGVFAETTGFFQLPTIDAVIAI